MSDYGMHKQYAKCMKTRSEGHALYRNVSAAILKPGACGYFDNDGDWKTIVQTTETEELLSHKLPALQGFRTWTDGGTEEWQGPITSEGVKGHRVDLSGQGGDGNNAVGAKLEFSSSRTHSAILIAEGVVEHHQGTPETRIQEWGSANAQALIDISGDRNVIKEKGFWIVTKTFTAKRCSISMLLEKDSTSSYSIDVRSEGVKVSPTVAWWKSQRDGDWRDLAHPDGVVMFMCGVWWRPRFLSKEMKAVSDKKKQKHLAGSDGPASVDIVIQVPASDELENYRLTPAAGGGNIQNLPRAKGSPYGATDSSDEEDEEDEGDDEENDEFTADSDDSDEE